MLSQIKVVSYSIRSQEHTIGIDKHNRMPSFKVYVFMLKGTIQRISSSQMYVMYNKLK